VVFLNPIGVHKAITRGHGQIKLLQHIFALCSLPPIFSKTFSLATLVQLHFITQLEIQVYNVILPTPVTFSCIFGVIIPDVSQLPKCIKTHIKLHKCTYKTAKNHLRLGLCPRPCWYIMPALPSDLIADQFTYRPTGSTTAALISLIHSVTQKLESCTYVRCLLVDYSKAFDVINHPILFRKILTLSMPSTGRSQAVHSGGRMSDWLSVTRSIIQGSSIGPSLSRLFFQTLTSWL